MPRRRRFGREVKLAAVKRMLAGENVRSLSRELNILRKTLTSGGPSTFLAAKRRCAGALFYDVNGNGAGGAIQFARFSTSRC